MTIVPLLLLILFSFLLIRITDLLIVHIKLLDDHIKLGGFAITTLLLGLATSLPELFVGVSSALEGSPNIALGNVIGSNIANLSLVAGLAALLGGTLRVRNGSTREDLLHSFVAGGAPLLLLYDQVLSRFDGMLLLLLYGFYNFTVLSHRTTGYEEDERIITKLIQRLRPMKTQREIGVIFLLVVGVFVSSDIIVRLARMVSSELGVPVFLVGLFVVAIGTSLPELVFELEAVKKGEAGMFMGNLMGSIVANGTLILGITSLIAPIRISALNEYFLASVFFVVIFFLFYLFTKTEHKLERWEGGALVFLYLLFLLLELI